MNDLLRGFCDFVLLGAVQNLPVLLLAFVLDRIFARLSWVGPRRVVWCLVVVELLLPPVFGSPVHVAGAEPMDVSLAPEVGRVWPLVLFWIWLAGASLCAACSFVAQRRLRHRLLAGAQPVAGDLQPLVLAASRRMGLRRVPRVLVSATASGPCVLGALRPVVLLDRRTSVSSDRTSLEHALLHEFGHVRRRDPLRALVMRSLACSWWFHPTVWLASRRFALLREVACDRLVTEVLGARSGYCHTLVARVADAGDLAATPALVRLPAEVVQRVAAMRHAGSHRTARSVASMVAAALLLACAVPLTAAVASRLPFGVTSLEELPGCITKRYFVLSQLSDESSPQGSSTEEPHDQGPR